MTLSVASRPLATHGALELGLCLGGRGRAVLRHRRQRFPLRTTVPFYLDSAAPDMAFIYVQNPTGGVFGGDVLDVSLDVDRGARAHLTTQSATKIYRMETGREARQEVRISVGEDGYAENVPDLMIPQAGSRYSQLTRIELAHDASCITTEVVSPGRRARGERFGYELLELSTEVWRDGRQLCVDTTRLRPARAGVEGPGVMGGAYYLVSVMALAPDRDLSYVAAAMDAALVELAPRGVVAAAAELPHDAGIYARALAPDTATAMQTMRCAWAEARRGLTGLSLPDVRK